MASSTPAPLAAVGGAEDEDLLSPSSAAVGGGGDGGGSGGAGDEDWAVALVLGVFVGIFVLGVCWCWCSHLRRKKRNNSSSNMSSGGSKGSSKGGSKANGSTAAVGAPPGPATSDVGGVDIDVDVGVDEEAATVPISDVTSGAAAAGMTATLGPPPGHDGALPTSSSSSAAATYRGIAAPGSHKLAENGPRGPALSTYSSSSFSSLNSAVVPTSLDITAGEGGGVAAGGGALVTLTTTKGVSSFATPVNYGEFPQPFSGLDVPVLPYERTNSRSSNGGFAATSDDGGGGGSGGSGGGEQQERTAGAFLSAGGQSFAEGGREEGWMAPPEIDVADLVMDNNEFYTPHGHGGSGSGGGGGGGDDGGGGRTGHNVNSNDISDNEALREAVVMVAVAAAETKALRRKSSQGAGMLSFDSVGGGSDADAARFGSRISVDTRSSAEDTDDDPLSAREDRSIAAAAVEAAAAAVAAAAAELSMESDPGAWDTSFSTDQGEIAAVGSAASLIGPGPARRSSGNGVTFGGERDGGGGGGGVVPPTPGSLPGLLSMSFSTSMVEEGFGQQPLSPNSAFVRSQTRESDSDYDNGNGNNHGHVDDSDGVPPSLAQDDSKKMPPPPPLVPSSSEASGRKQQLLQKPFRRSLSRYSSEFDDGSGMALPSLPEMGACGAGGGGGVAGNGAGSVRYPFLLNASTGGGGHNGGAEGRALSRIPSSLSILDSSEDEADGSATRMGCRVGVLSGKHGAPAASVGRGKSGENNDDRSPSISSSCGVGGTGTGGSAPGGGALGFSVEDDDVEQGIPQASGTASSLTHDAVRRAAAQPWGYGGGRTLRKIKSIDEGSDEQECFGSSRGPGLFPLSSSISNTARFFRSNGSGGGGGGGATGVVSGVLGSCVGLTPPATPDASAAGAAAAARLRRGGARKTLQQANNFDTGRLTDTVGWHGGGGGADKIGDKPGDADFDTGPFFLCGGDADGKSQATAPREGEIAQSGTAAGGIVKGDGGGGSGGDSASPGLFDSTKRWFDSVSTVIAGGGGGQNNFAVEPASLTNTE